MYTLGHVGAALLVSAPIAGTLTALGNPQIATLTLAVAVACSMLPDVDEWLPITHRGPTHTVWFVGVVGSVIFGLGAVSPLTVSDAAILGATATLSVLSHLLGDSITPMGIAPFRPLWEFHHSFDIVPSKDGRANLALFWLGIVVAGAGQIPGVL